MAVDFGIQSNTIIHGKTLTGEASPNTDALEPATGDLVNETVRLQRKVNDLLDRLGMSTSEPIHDDDRAGIIPDLKRACTRVGCANDNIDEIMRRLGPLEEGQ